MLLSRLQSLIGGIYDVSIAHDVYDFLVTDRRRLPAAARGGSAEEELLVAQPAHDGDELALSLYLDPALLARLARADPLVRLHGGNVADWLTALEGVSHFLYLAWNAAHDKPVSLLELEMQAEVDKYVASYWLLRRQLPGHFPAELRRLLFARTHIDPRAARARRPVSRGQPLCGQVLCASGTHPGAQPRRSRATGRRGCAARRAAPFLPADQRAQARTHRGSRLKAHPRRAAAAAHSSLPSPAAPPLLSPPPLRLRSSSSRIILIHSESLRRSVRVVLPLLLRATPRPAPRA